MKTLLVVAAHPDDEILGCGGTLLKLSRTHACHILIMGEGVTARATRRQDADRSQVRRLAEEADLVRHALGARSLTMFELPDNRFDEVPLLDIVKRVEKVIAEVRPEIVLTHHPGDLNIDHRLAYEAVMPATRPLPGCPVKEVLSFEAASASDWSFQRIGPPFRPNVFVDVSATIDAKLEALELYREELREFPHPRSPDALRATAARWGTVSGFLAAEAFELIRSCGRF